MRRAAAAVLLLWVLAPIAGATLPTGSGGMGMECCVRMGDACECRVLAGISRCPESQSLTPPRFVTSALSPSPPFPEIPAAGFLTSRPQTTPSSFFRTPSTPPPRG